MNRVDSFFSALTEVFWLVIGWVIGLAVSFAWIYFLGVFINILVNS